MKVTPETTVRELMARFPRGFAIGPGTPERPGELSHVIAATSHLSKIMETFPVASGNQGYMVVDMDPPINGLWRECRDEIKYRGSVIIERFGASFNMTGIHGELLEGVDKYGVTCYFNKEMELLYNSADVERARTRWGDQVHCVYLTKNPR